MHRVISCFGFLFLFFLQIALLAQVEGDQTIRPKVMVMEVRSEIDPRMNRYVSLALDYAEKNKIDYILVDMDTYGGILTDAQEIVDRIMDVKIPIWVFINSDAASAGALISIACDSIYMSPAASIGAATVVNGVGGEAAPDKYQSYMRSIMRSTAEANNRDPRIAEGMVDERIVIDSLKQAGKVITLTTAEAIKFGFCEARVSSIEEILERNGIKNYELERFNLSLTERIISFFMNPLISGLLILIIIGGIYFELQSPGIGFPLFAAFIALILYLVPYYLNGLAENWEIIALFSGLLLIAAEIFFIPGFGVTGITGITLTLGSLILIMLNNDYFNFDLVQGKDIMVAGMVAIGGMAGGIFLLFAGGAKLLKTSAFQQIALTDTQGKEKGYIANFVPEVKPGALGIAQTVLRPGGKVEIDGKIYDAFTRGEYIEKGESITVVDVEASTLKVKISS